jgi:hypothetical protein
VKDLAVRLEALDADAGAALRVIAYFDSLTESKAGLQAIVRGAAVLAGCPARLDDHGRRVHVRVDQAGSAAPAPGAGDAAWMRTLVVPDGSATLALERTGEPGPVEAMILERASGAARAVLDRTRGRVPAADPALVELVVDASASADVRLPAVHHLALAAGVRAVALPTGPALLPPGAAPAFARAGVGPAVFPIELPVSYAAARVALRFAAEGTPEDPGPTVVDHDSLGALAALAAVPSSLDVPDLRALDHAVNAAPWALVTLSDFADAPSLRAAAASLRLHHSTLQDRITQAAHLLGWPLTTPAGRLRLQVALTLRRLRRHP